MVNPSAAEENKLVELPLGHMVHAVGGAVILKVSILAAVHILDFHLFGGITHGKHVARLVAGVYAKYLGEFRGIESLDDSAAEPQGVHP